MRERSTRKLSVIFSVFMLFCTAMSQAEEPKQGSTSFTIPVQVGQQWALLSIKWCNNMWILKWGDGPSTPPSGPGPYRPEDVRDYCFTCQKEGKEFGGTTNDTKSISCKQSFIDNIIANHHHLSVDYRVGNVEGNSGCKPCGAAERYHSGLRDLAIVRHHRYRETSQGGSFGAGVFLERYGARLTLYRDNSSNIAEWFDPFDVAPRRFVDGANGDTKDGVYFDQANKMAKELKLFDASSQLATNVDLAKTAILTLHSGEKHYFDIVDLGAGTSEAVSGAAPWRKIDIGRVARIGDTSISGGTYTVTGSGRDIWNQQDEAHYAFQALRGNGSITAKVNSLTNTDANAKAGVMLRESLQDGSRFAFMTVTPTNGIAFQRRTSAFGSVVNKSVSTVEAPYWVKLVRTGNVFTSYRSEDGASWTLVGQETIAMSAAVFVGLCNTSHNNAVLNTSTFDNISVTGGSAPPWTSQDIGAVGVAGSSNFDGTTYTVSGSGADIWNNADAFHFVHQQVTGDCTIVARVSGQQNSNEWAKAGVMVRESLNADSAHAMTVLTPLNGVAFQRRIATAGVSTNTNQYVSKFPYWVRLTRTGSTITAFQSVDGTTWKQVGTETITFGNDVFVGLAVTSHKDGAIATGVFDNVALVGTPTPAAEWPAENITHDRIGRLTRLEDRNGYGVQVAYKTFTPADIEASPSRQLQINTITDAYGRMATFTYNAAQQSGLWAVSNVSLPNGENLQYQYAGGKLSGVVLPDSTQSAFTYGFDNASQCSTIFYDDVAADGTHRRKTVYLSNNYAIPNITEENAQIVNQASLLVRMVVNGDNEVSYLNAPNPNHASNNEILIYEGAGSLRRLHGVWESRHYKDGWQITNPAIGLDGVSGTLEAIFAKTPVDHEALKKGTYLSMTNEQGVTCSYEYDADTFVTKKTYPDATTEKWQYNAFKQITRFEDRLGRVTRYSFDARGNMLTKEVGIKFVAGTDVNQPEYALYQWEYYAAGHANQFLLKTEFEPLFSAGQPDLYRTDYVYDASNLLVKRVEAADISGGARAEKTYVYDANKRLQKCIDPLGRETQYVYDSRDRLAKIIYADGSTERFVFGTGSDSNLLIKQKDRNGNVTKFEYDLSGRTVKTISAYSKMDLNDNETLVTDVSVKVEDLCSYLPGTEVKQSCSRGGELTEYLYDYRHRVKSVTVRPRQDIALTTTNTFINNLLFSTQDAYGRKSYFKYRTSDSKLTRTVRGTMPTYSLADFTAVANATRNLTNNAAFVIEDSELDAAGQTLAHIDGRNIRHTMSYDSRGRTFESIEAESVGGIASPDAAKTVYDYDANSNRIRIKNPRTFTEASNFFTEFTYSGRSLLASKTEAAGKPEAATMSYAYLLDRRLAETTDGRNNIWKQTWKDCCARIATKVDPLLADGTRPYTYFQQDFNGNTTHVVRLKDFATFANCCMNDPIDTDTLSEATTKFDARHRAVAQTTWLIARGAVDPNDVPIAGDNGVPATDGLTTRWRYDENLTDSQGIDADYSTQINARLGVGYFGSNANGYAIETTNPAGEKSVSIYDGMCRMILQIDGNLNSVKSTYDVVVNGLLETSAVDALNHMSKSRADGIGRVRESVDAENRITTFEYDANANRVKFRNANIVGQDCVFDDRNRDKQCTDTAVPPSVTKMIFDAHNNVTVLTDSMNKTAVCAFDARDRKISYTDRISGLTAFAYDKNNNLTRITDAEGGVTDYTYDQRNLLSAETFPAHNKPDGHYDIREYAYDAANRLKMRKDQFLVVTTYIYDLANRLLSRVYPDALNDTFTYDAASRVLSAANSRYNNLVTRDYTLGGEAAGRLKRETQTIGGTPYQVSYTYDNANRQTSVTYPTGEVATRTFTDRNQLSAVNFNGNAVASFIYDNGMRRTQTTFGNGVVEGRTYFSDNLNNTIKANKGVTKVTDFTYSWDTNKRKTAEADGVVPPVNSQTFGYDDEDRLASFARNNGDTQSWNLSVVGDWNTFTKNGSAETRQHNDAHEIKQIGATSVLHDLKGNLTAHSNGQTYIWDIENRLNQAVVPAGSTMGVVGTHAYAYDALGRRVSKTVGATTTVFVNDGLQEICEYENGTFTRSYVFGSYIDEPLRMTVASGSNVYYYHTNQIYSIAALTDSTGTCVERYTYDPYGKVVVLDGSGSVVGNVSAKGNPWTFTGRRLDSESGLMYYRARMYSPELGRFAGRDPLLYEDGLNLFSYVGSQPTLWTDPKGKARIVVIITFADDGITGVANGAARTEEASVNGYNGTGPNGSFRVDAFDGYKEVPDGNLSPAWDTLYKQILKRGDYYDPTGKAKDCIEEVKIQGHGSPGGLSNSRRNFAKHTSAKDLNDPKSEVSIFLAKLKHLWCKENKGIVLNACEQAEGGAGKEFMMLLAQLSGAKVKGWTGWFIAGPSGDEYTATPDGGWSKTGNAGPAKTGPFK